MTGRVEVDPLFCGHGTHAISGVLTKGQEGPWTQQRRECHEQCVQRAARAVSHGYQVLYFFPIDEAVRLILRPGGPQADELRARILEKRRTRLGP